MDITLAGVCAFVTCHRGSLRCFLPYMACGQVQNSGLIEQLKQPNLSPAKPLLDITSLLRRNCTYRHLFNATLSTYIRGLLGPTIILRFLYIFQNNDDDTSQFLFNRSRYCC